MKDHSTICYSEAKFLQKPECVILLKREVSDLDFLIYIIKDQFQSN